MKALINLVANLPKGTHVQMMDEGKFALITGPEIDQPYILNTKTGRKRFIDSATETQQ